MKMCCLFVFCLVSAGGPGAAIAGQRSGPSVRRGERREQRRSVSGVGDPRPTSKHLR